MSCKEEIRAAVIRTLPVLPGTLFRLHNFYNVDVAVMVEAIDTDDMTILACLAEARSIAHNRYPASPKPRFEPDGAGLPILMLEQRLRSQYRAAMEAAFAGSGYHGEVSWPDEAGNIEADEDAAAQFVVSCLRAPLRKVVARYSRPGIATVALWHRAFAWQPIARDRLLEVTSEIRCSGWRPFGLWLADRIAPDRHYPDGIVHIQRLRRPLPEEDGWYFPSWPHHPDMQRRFDGLPLLTRHVYALFHLYGRQSREIAARLGISRSSVRRRLDRAFYMVMDGLFPRLYGRSASIYACVGNGVLIDVSGYGECSAIKSCTRNPGQESVIRM